MQPVIQDFVAWFGRFVFVSTVLLVGSYIVGSKLRARREKAAAEAAETEKNSAPAGMTKRVRRENPERQSV